MVIISGVCTRIGSFERRNGDVQDMLEIEGLQVNIPKSVEVPAIGDWVDYFVSIRQLDKGRLAISMIMPAPRSAAAPTR